VAPGAVFHERHQLAAGAFAVVAGRGVALIGEFPGRGDFEVVAEALFDAVFPEPLSWAQFMRALAVAGRRDGMFGWRLPGVGERARE
jgi:hypothetical protein